MFVAVFLGLFGAIQFFRIFVDHLPFWPKLKVVAVGDSIAVPGFLAIAAAALQASKTTPPERFYHHWWWFAFWAVVFLVLNTLNEWNNVRNGYPLEKELKIGQIYHFLIVPLLGALVVGILPHIYLDVESEWGLKIAAALMLALYLTTFIYDFAKFGGTPPES